MRAEVLAAAVELREQMQRFLEPVGDATVVLNPLQYAWEPHAAYIERYAPTSAGGALWLGMNPGPWGMAQTGVPFGAVPRVRDFLKISGRVDVPAVTHPKRPIQGFECTRNEVSGDRLWGAVEAVCETPERFFARHFVTNYCPLLWQSARGTNLTPDKLPSEAMAPILAACDAHLAQVIRATRPARVIGVGAWAEKCAQRVVDTFDLDVPVGRVLHPSPASPAANRGWAEAAVKQLAEQGHPL